MTKDEELEENLEFELKKIQCGFKLNGVGLSDEDLGQIRVKYNELVPLKQNKDLTFSSSEGVIVHPRFVAGPDSTWIFMGYGLGWNRYVKEDLRLNIAVEVYSNPLLNGVNAYSSVNCSSPSATLACFAFNLYKLK